jgi:hypothetical protein
MPAKCGLKTPGCNAAHSGNGLESNTEAFLAASRATGWPNAVPRRFVGSSQRLPFGSWLFAKATHASSQLGN